MFYVYIILHYRALTECLILTTVFQMILKTHIVPQVKVSLRTRTRMQAKQSNALLINIHNLNSHLIPENTITTEEFIEKYSNKTPNPVFFQHEQDIILSQYKYMVTSLIDFGSFKNIFSKLLTYTGNLQQKFHRYASMKVYSRIIKIDLLPLKRKVE